MNVKLKRTVRTPHSEEIQVFDLDSRDHDDNPANIGKLDIHFLQNQITGTLLIWEEYATGFSRVHRGDAEYTLDTLIDEILTEASEPLGVPAEYGIEVYYPSIARQGFFSNVADDESGEEETFPYEEADQLGEERPEEEEDDFTRRLRQRP